MTAINWPLLILTDSPEFPRKLTIAGMVRMCGNEAKVTNKKFDGNWETRIQGTWPIQILSCYQKISSSLSRGEFDALRLLVIDKFRKAHFCTHVSIKVSYFFMLLKHAIWTIFFNLMHSVCQKRVISEHKRLIQ